VMGSWSYRRLEAAFGEDAALSLLQYMPGLGDFESFIPRATDPYRDVPCIEVHDEAPVHYAADTFAMLSYEDWFVRVETWKKNKNEETT
jgi:hypothetical protein